MKRQYVVVAMGRPDEYFATREEAEGYAFYLTAYMQVVADVFPFVGPVQ